MQRLPCIVTTTQGSVIRISASPHRGLALPTPGDVNGRHPLRCDIVVDRRRAYA